jgi:2-methylcitrate dehydratase PrpD
VLGIDVSCRVGNMIYPDTTTAAGTSPGSTGMLGAAARVPGLLKLDASQTQMALGIAGLASRSASASSSGR